MDTGTDWDEQEVRGEGEVEGGYGAEYDYDSDNSDSNIYDNNGSSTVSHDKGGIRLSETDAIDEAGRASPIANARSDRRRDHDSEPLGDDGDHGRESAGRAENTTEEEEEEEKEGNSVRRGPELAQSLSTISQNISLVFESKASGWPERGSFLGATSQLSTTSLTAVLNSYSVLDVNRKIAALMAPLNNPHFGTSGHGGGDGTVSIGNRTDMDARYEQELEQQREEQKMLTQQLIELGLEDASDWVRSIALCVSHYAETGVLQADVSAASRWFRDTVDLVKSQADGKVGKEEEEGSVSRSTSAVAASETTSDKQAREVEKAEAAVDEKEAKLRRERPSMRPALPFHVALLHPDAQPKWLKLPSFKLQSKTAHTFTGSKTFKSFQRPVSGDASRTYKDRQPSNAAESTGSAFPKEADIAAARVADRYSRPPLKRHFTVVRPVPELAGNLERGASMRPTARLRSHRSRQHMASRNPHAPQTSAGHRGTASSSLSSSTTSSALSSASSLSSSRIGGGTGPTPFGHSGAHSNLSVSLLSPAATRKNAVRVHGISRQMRSKGVLGKQSTSADGSLEREGSTLAGKHSDDGMRSDATGSSNSKGTGSLLSRRRSSTTQPTTLRMLSNEEVEAREREKREAREREEKAKLERKQQREREKKERAENKGKRGRKPKGAASDDHENDGDDDDGHGDGGEEAKGGKETEAAEAAISQASKRDGGAAQQPVTDGEKVKVKSEKDHQEEGTPAKKGRGRPKKSEAPSTAPTSRPSKSGGTSKDKASSANVKRDEAGDGTATPSQEATTKRKRGRPRKQPAEQQPSSAKPASSTVSKKKKGQGKRQASPVVGGRSVESEEGTNSAQDPDIVRVKKAKLGQNQPPATIATPTSQTTLQQQQQQQQQAAMIRQQQQQQTSLQYQQMLLQQAPYAQQRMQLQNDQNKYLQQFMAQQQAQQVHLQQVLTSKGEHVQMIQQHLAALHHRQQLEMQEIRQRLLAQQQQLQQQQHMLVVQSLMQQQQQQQQGMPTTTVMATSAMAAATHPMAMIAAKQQEQAAREQAQAQQGLRGKPMKATSAEGGDERKRASNEAPADPALSASKLGAVATKKKKTGSAGVSLLLEALGEDND